MNRRLGIVWLQALAVLALLGCTHVPFDTPREPSRALPAAGTQAARTARAVSGDAPDSVAMAPLADGNDALGARLQMIEAAERSIDLKTFLIKPDIAGALIWLQLYEAAERGVRVRLLFDDVFTEASDAQIAALDAHPNVEVRVFNPLSRNTSRMGNFMLDFARVNRRMHNKALVVDGSFAVIGGRNIADEYYQIGNDHIFADFDLFLAGPRVSDLSSAFDLYWNDPWSLPLVALAPGPAPPLSDTLRRLRDAADTPQAQIYRRATESRYIADLQAGRVPLFRGRASVIVDDPEKLRNPPDAGPFVVGEELYRSLRAAQNDVLVMTPYFVPEPYGARVFEELAARGVRVRIATNSLASTNHPYVHGGYAKYRDRLLAAGVTFLEARADAAHVLGVAPVGLTMHTKLAVIDGRTLFIGSPNLDPRSIRQNAEIALRIDSPALARDLIARVDEIARDFAFTLSRDAKGRTVWHYNGTTRQERFETEPLAGPLDRLIATLTGWLPVESQL